MKKRFFWQLFPSYLVILFLSIFLSFLYATNTLKNIYIEKIKNDLKVRATLIETRLEASQINNAEVHRLCRELGKKIQTRITVINSKGEIIGDTDEDPAEMDNHKNRPEVAQAFSEKEGVAIRHSSTLDRDMIYVAIPIKNNGAVETVIRASIPLTDVSQVLNATYMKIVVEFVLIVLISFAISYFMSRRVIKPLEELEKGAKNFAKGNLKLRLSVSKTKEIGELANAMNEMASQLDWRISQITQQNREQEIILSQVAEGVIAIDSDKKIIKINRAAAELLGMTEPFDSGGREIQDIILNKDLKEFINKALESDEPLKEDIVIYGGNKENGNISSNINFIEAYSAGMQDTDGHNIETLIILNDITQITKLENIRRDFIANVSHELRTPITSIKGYSETLLDGALSDYEDAQRFVKIILSHADRLNNIIEDLLSLSRLQQGVAGTEELAPENTDIRSTLISAVQLCKVKADSRNINIELKTEGNIFAMVKASLLEQAVVNLIDNAVKYSPNDGFIVVEAYIDRNKEKMPDYEIVIKVSDNGCGIPKEHLPRIFERFYRVDKARSRKLGGTGLGLSIVKHIAQLHDGYVQVESTVGEGSVFSIHLPFSTE